MYQLIIDEVLIAGNYQGDSPVSCGWHQNNELLNSTFNNCSLQVMSVIVLRLIINKISNIAAALLSCARTGMAVMYCVHCFTNY